MKKSHNKPSSIFTSKSNVLKFLQSKTSKSKIEKIYDFTVYEWNKENKKIINTIKSTFQKNIIVRSSVLGEDSLESSVAPCG